MTRLLMCLAALCGMQAFASAALRLPSFFSDHMILQHGRPAPVWGWDKPGTKIRLDFAGQNHETVADAAGKWRIVLRPSEVSWESRSILITGSERREIRDVLVGEVWICSGQSNMNLTLRASHNGDLEMSAANRRGLRLLKLPLVGTQVPQDDIPCTWASSTSATAGEFSAVGFVFGRILLESTQMPIGLIHNAWGGSEAEAWIRRSSLENDPRFAALISDAVDFEQAIDSGEASATYPAAIAQWNAAAEETRRNKMPLPAQPFEPSRWLKGNARPGNIFNGMINPIAGFAIRGVIWYQGESNARRAHEYRQLFPFLIEEWRRAWNQGDFPFYWVQLPDHRWERSVPGESDWAELREAQTMALRLPNTGQAVTIDLGEGNDIHPRAKQEVAARLARWALARDYGLDVPHRSPEFEALKIEGAKAIVTIDTFGSQLRTIDTDEIHGFAICGDDHIWHFANARFASAVSIEVWSDDVPAPRAVRYAWADNPVCNVIAEHGLPLTPFRTDDFPLTTAGKSPATASDARRAVPLKSGVR